MPKRVRGPVRAQRRPGTRPVTPRSPSARRAPVVPSQLEAAEVIAQDIVEQNPADSAGDAERGARSTRTRTRAKPGSLLAVRAVAEYVYVGQDLRRIGVVATVLFGILFVLWLLLIMLKVVTLPFY